jgi:DNA helicase-2/ATP-dependent DNA helicase PcrA
LVLSVAARYGALSYRPSRFLAPIEASLGEQLIRDRWWQETPAGAETIVMRAARTAQAREKEPLTAFALETYQRCPRQYAYRYVDRLQPHGASMTALQTALKRALDGLHEAMASDKGEAARNEALALFESAFDDTQSGRRADDPYAPLYRRYGRLAVEREWEALNAPTAAPDSSTPPRAERDRTVEFRVGDTTIEVTIDQVEQAPRKTASGPHQPDAAEMRYVRRKLGSADDRGGLREYLYTLAAEQRANGKAPAQVAQRHVATGEVTPVTISERRRATLRRDLQATIDGIHREEYPARPDPRACAACPFLLICPS